MIKDLNWRTLEQRRIDSRLTLMYEITYVLVVIPAADYLIPNTQPPISLQANSNTQRLLRVHIHSPHPGPPERPPILHPCFTYCGIIQSCCVPSSTRLTIDIRSDFTFLTILNPHLFFRICQVLSFFSGMHRKVNSEIIQLWSTTCLVNEPQNAYSIGVGV